MQLTEVMSLFMSEVRDWLESLGLGQYADAFEENAIEPAQLADLDHEVLLAVGVRAAGHRMRILKAVAELAPRSEDAGREERGAATASTPMTTGGEPERRQLTVMFCDLVGSVEIGERMEVEEYRDLLGRFRTTVVEVVQQFDGFIARHLGDGLLVYFGYPRAREDDAERAVRAGLGVVEAIVDLEHPHHAELGVRVGIATGLAVVGDVLSTSTSGHTEVAALGPTPNLAARLQAEAPENAVLVSEVTRGLVTGFFELETLAPRQLKGIPGETAIFRVRSPLAGHSRFAARTRLELSPFTGREEELEVLQRRWRRADEGRGQAVVIVGEPGIGKSRLLAEFRSTLTPPPHELLLFQSAPHLNNSALHPVVRALEDALDLAGAQDEEAKLQRLSNWLVGRKLPVGESLGLLAELLSISTEDRLAATMGSQQRRERLLAWLVELVAGQPDARPVLCVFEDLHWADPTTRELLEKLVEAIDRTRVLVVGTARPGFSAPWSDLPNVRWMTLSQLDRAESERLAASVLEGESTRRRDLIDNILHRAGGNPLFIEELVRAVMQSGSSSGEQRAIPATLQDSLMARLDALPFGKPVAQWGSVIGREFNEDILRAAWDDTDEALSKGLGELCDSGLLHRRGEGPQSPYRFKHALVGDTAYGSMLRSVRQSRHARVLESLETLQADAASEVLAHHATEAGLLERAIEYWEAAGRGAAGRSANLEAIGHLRRGISLVEASGIDKPETELALWSALGPLLMLAEGDASKSAEDAFRRALSLAERLGSAADEQYPLAWGLWYMHMQRGSRPDVERLAARLERMSAESGRSDLAIETYHSLWTFNMHYGELDLVRESTDAALTLYDEVEHRDLRFQFANHDPRMCAFFHLAMAETVCGRLGRGEDAIAEALRWAVAIEHLPTLAIARLVPLVVGFWKGDPVGVQATSQAFMDTCDDVGADWYRAVGAIFDGWAEALGTPDGDAHRRVAQALETVRATGQVTRMPMYYTALAESLRASGHLEDALAAARQAIRSCEETGQVVYEPQAWNTFGAIRRSLYGKSASDWMDSAMPFTRGLAAARAIEAPLLGLHPALSLAELYRDHGQAGAARELLVPLLDILDRGRDAPVVSRARDLLAELD